jgi:hypothetical protein
MIRCTGDVVQSSNVDLIVLSIPWAARVCLHIGGDDNRAKGIQLPALSAYCLRQHVRRITDTNHASQSCAGVFTSGLRHTLYPFGHKYRHVLHQFARRVDPERLNPLALALRLLSSSDIPTHCNHRFDAVLG